MKEFVWYTVAGFLVISLVAILVATLAGAFWVLLGQDLLIPRILVGIVVLICTCYTVGHFMVDEGFFYS